MHIMKYSTHQMLSQTHIGSLSLISLMDSYSLSFLSSIDKCLSFTYTLKCWRIVAQRLAHLVRDQGVGGSNPPCPKEAIDCVGVQLNRGKKLVLHLKWRFSGVFSWCMYNSSRKSLWRKLKSIRLDANPVRIYRMIVIYGSLFAILSPFLYWFRTGQETFIIIAWNEYDKTFCRSNICVGHDQLLFFYKQGCLIVM